MSPRVLFEQDLETLKIKYRRWENMRRSVMTICYMESGRTKRIF